MMRWQMVEKFGWTLDQVDALSVADWHEYLQIQMGRNKARK
jgi:hypothetical protein